jgi:hypothetical protein
MVTNELIDAIRGLLAGRPTAVAGEVLALEYARQCREVNARLGKIALMLEGGGEIQALQLAEQPPPVVDAALALSFGGESAWLDYCHDRGHEVAPVIDARSLESLLAIQRKGLASNHPLYRDYRAAVSSRDDERAHDLIRVIARLNPGDENAAKELKRLQRKALHAALAELQDSLGTDGEPLLAAMRKVEEAGAAEDYEALPEWKQAVGVRNRLRRDAAWQRLPEVLRQAEGHLATGEWRQAAVLHGEFGILAGTYGFNDATAGLAERARAIEVELDRHRAEAARAAEVRHLAAELAHTADEVETQALLPGGLTPGAAAPLLDELTRKLRQHESLRGEFADDGTQERITAAVARLTQVLETAKRRRRLRLAAGLTAAALVVLATALISVLVWRASSQATLLASLHRDQSVSGVQALVSRIRHDEPLLLKFPELAAQVAQASLWAETMAANAATVGMALTELETARRGGFDALDSPALLAKLQAVEGLAENLPPELRTAAAARFNLVQADAQQVLANRRQQADAAAKALAARWTTEINRIDFTGPVAVAGEILEPAAGELAPVLELAASGSPGFSLSETTAAMIGELAAKVRELQEQVTAVTNAQSGLQRAETSESYREALGELAACQFAEGAAAKRVMAAWPNAERVKALLVFRGDVAALEAAASDARGPLPLPETVDARDREIIEKLTGSEVLNNIWEVVWKNGKGLQFACLSRGEVERNGKDGWKGWFAPYPKMAANSAKGLNFKGNTIPAAGGNILVANRPTATAVMMSKLKLGELLHANGVNFRASVLPLLDTVANDEQAKPLAKAYVLSHLYRLVQNHPPVAWGLHYCPGLADEIKAFQALELKAPLLEAAWLLEKEPDYAKVWADFFTARGRKWGFEEMRKTRAAAAAVLHQEAGLAGRVRPDGTAELTHAPVSRLLLAVCDTGDGKLELRVSGIAPARAETFPATPAAVAFSPLLAFDLSDESQAFLLSIHQPRVPAASNPQVP